ncbi:MAG: helix-turn-helix transcriptional regulator [Thermoanaerobaculia bacterium]
MAGSKTGGQDPALPLLTLVGDLYAAGLGEIEWATALARLATAFAAPRAALLVRQGSGLEVAAESAAPRPGRERSFAAPGDADVLLVVARDDFDPQAEARLTALAGEAARAHRFGARRQALARDGDLAAAALDRLALGSLMLDRQGRVERTNLAARGILESTGDLFVEDGRLRLADRALELELAAMVDRVLDPQTPEKAPMGGALQVPRSTGGHFQLLVAPLQRGGEERAAAGCAVFVSAPDAGLEAPAEVLGRLYRLTQKESELVAQILEGRTLDEAAAKLDIGRETAKTHLKRIFTKVGTTRQVDLVRLLLTGAVRLRWE